MFDPRNRIFGVQFLQLRQLRAGLLDLAGLRQARGVNSMRSEQPEFVRDGLSANDSLAQLTMSSDGVLVLFPSGTRPGICTNGEAGHAEESVGSINYNASTTLT